MRLLQGEDIRIFTARVCGYRSDTGERMDPDLVRWHIQQWCLEHLGCVLPITNEKDMDCREIWDDGVVAFERNTGRILGGPGHGKPSTV